MTSNATRESLIGIIGGAASGKDTVAQIFERYGYVHTSASDCVRAEISRRSLLASRALQTKIANEMRELHGEGFWVSRALAQVAPGAGKVAISGLYAPGEGRYLVASMDGALVAVTSSSALEDDSAIRFERLRNRGDGLRDQVTQEEFEAAESRENSGVAGYEANIAALQGMAEFTIFNTGDLDYLDTQVQTVVQQLEVRQ